jgi:hypothetical protein
VKGNSEDEVTRAELFAISNVREERKESEDSPRTKEVENAGQDHVNPT